MGLKVEKPRAALQRPLPSWVSHSTHSRCPRHVRFAPDSYRIAALRQRTKGAQSPTSSASMRMRKEGLVLRYLDACGRDAVDIAAAE